MSSRRQFLSKSALVAAALATSRSSAVTPRVRGTLTHHYWTDERGVLTRVNLIVGTTNNYAPINLSIKQAAKALIRKGTTVTEGLLNKIEMAFRAYDPCFGCATHYLPGQMPLTVVLRAPDGQVLQTIRREAPRAS